MVLARIYDCLAFLLNVVLIRLPQAERDAEILLLRHELGVLRRSVKKPGLRPLDRLVLTALAMRLPRSAWGGLIVRPGTVLGWHRALVRQKWAAYGRRRRSGRPRMPEECRQLILRLAKENPGWGYIRIRGELLKLGYAVSATAIRNLLRRHCVPTSPRRSQLSWRQFLRAQASAIVAADYFTVDIWNLKRLHVLFFIGLATRRILWFGVTEKPDQAWVSQQARNLNWVLQELGLEPRFLICDNDKKFSLRLRERSGGRRIDRDPDAAAGSDGERLCGALGW